MHVLLYRVFEETGGGGLPVLDDEGKNLILRKIAGDYESELKMLGGHMKKQGYISEVKSVISEFTQYDIGEDEIERVMESAGESSRLYYKLADIRLLYRGFTDYLREKYITKEELLDVLSCEVEKSERLKNSTVVLDGFTRFHTGSGPPSRGADETLPRSDRNSHHGSAGKSVCL